MMNFELRNFRFAENGVMSKKQNVIQTKTFEFALRITKLCKSLQKSTEYMASKQLFRSGTSIGANVEEALAGQSRKDFVSKMSIALKEARETLYWLRLLQESQLVEGDYSVLIAEIKEIILILTSIVKTTVERQP
jgi:four helix bundle protein